MIESFRHKGLKQFYEKNDRSGLTSDQVAKIKMILSSLDAAETPDELHIPTFHFHSLAGDRKGFFSITVRANWRITFRFENGKVYDLNLEDYH
jgi:proteic killer suppression protein